ncbi:MAG: DUF1345 domain-containing protein [Pseudomonadota bacterium]
MAIHHILQRFVATRPHLSFAIALGVAVGLFVPGTISPVMRALIGWNAAIWPYMLAMLAVIVRADHQKVRQVAVRQYESAGMVLAGLVVAAAMSVTAIVAELGKTGALDNSAPALRYGFTALTVFGSWFLLGMLFSFHYAHVFYHAAPDKLPLQFPLKEDDPNYWDFLYFSFTIAVAVQTSDVQVMTRTMRKLVLAQSILSFFFNLAVLGLCINIAAGLMNN